MTRRRLGLVLVAGCLACSGSPDDDSPRWVRVARDANYTIYIDTGRLGVFEQRGYAVKYHVWYRTDHAIPRMHEKDSVRVQFNREIVHSIISCDSLRFRVASVDMSMGREKPVVQQRLTERELSKQKWRRVELGTAEEIAGRAACHFATAR